MLRLPPRPNLHDTLCPYTSLFRSGPPVRQRSNLIILFGIAFFLIGGVIVFLVLNEDDDEGPTAAPGQAEVTVFVAAQDRSEEHTSELQSLMRTSYAVFCLQKKKTNT